MSQNLDVVTYWNGLPAHAIKGTAVVDDDNFFPQYWAREEGLIGERISVVRVVPEGLTHGPRVDYLDNRTGQGWFKVTDGHGLPTYGHSNVTIVPNSFEADTV